jgi:Na+/melibiose symporter-like transporter
MAITLTFLSLFGVIFLLTQYMQAVLGFSPLKAGAVLVPQGVAMMVMAPLSARVSERIGTKLTVGAGLLVVATSLALFELVKVNSAIGLVIVITVILGVGMANVMAPATESIMSTLPREKAGVGSAVSNTIRQLGGALGVAVLGSLIAATYRTEMTDTVAKLPEPVQHAARESIAGTYGVAGRLGPAGHALIGPANTAFVHAMHLAAVGSAVVALLGTLVVLAWLPRRSGPASPPVPVVTPDQRTEPDEQKLAEVS